MKIELILFVALSFPLSSFAKVKKPDPRNYFRQKSWSIDDGSQKNNHFIYAASTYNGKPKQKPNSLMVEHRCGAKIIPMAKLKYCGIDSVKIVNRRLEIVFSDYVSKGSTGYCTKQRAQYFNIPPCNKDTAPKKSQTK